MPSRLAVFQCGQLEIYLVDIFHGNRPFLWSKCAEDENEYNDVGGTFRKIRG